MRIGEAARPPVQSPAGKLVAPAFGVAVRRGPLSVKTPQHCAHPRQQLPQVEGLRHIIVGAELKTDDAIDFIPAVTGCDYDRDVGTRADLAQEIETVPKAEPKVKDHQVDILRAELTNHLLAAGRQKRVDVVIDEVV
jgi:hypothetical protein